MNQKYLVNKLIKKIYICIITIFIIAYINIIFEKEKNVPEVIIERVPVLLACNMDVSENVHLIVMGKYATTHCFTNTETLPVSYESIEKTWTHSDLLFLSVSFELTEKT